MPIITFSQYATYLSQYGFVGGFGLDTSSRKFKVPYLNNIFLEAVTDSTQNSAAMLSGLPNITGAMQTNHSLGLFASGQGEGAVYLHENYGGSVAGASGSYSKGFRFDASRSNSIYGSSNIVQPPAVKYFAMVQIK